MALPVESLFLAPVDNPVVFLESSEYAESSGAKFVVDGSFLLDSDPSTKGWLAGVRALQLIDPGKSLGMPNKKILEGFLKDRSADPDSRKRVVLKVADDSGNADLKVEWATYQTLAANGVPGIAEYLGFFTCKDTLTRVLEKGMNDEGICEGAGESLQVLVMEHVDNPSMKYVEWGEHSSLTLQSCLMQVICTLVEGYVRCGFTHGDMHLDNVLLERIDDADVGKFHRYETADMGIKAGAFRTMLMDLELSKTREWGGASPEASRLFFMDVRNFLNKAIYDLVWCLADLKPLSDAYAKVERWRESGEKNAKIILTLAVDIQRLAVKESCSKNPWATARLEARRPADRDFMWGSGSSRRRTRPSLSKRRGPVW